VTACDYCKTQRPASEVFEPYRGAVRCRDVAGCERRQIRAFDPTVPLDEDLPTPPTVGAPPGAACAVCGAPGPRLYERIPHSGQYVCRDRDACQQQSIEYQYLRAWGDSSPDRLITSAEMRQVAGRPPEMVARPGSVDFTMSMPSHRYR
jgi:hypothetical protein